MVFTTKIAFKTIKTMKNNSFAKIKASGVKVLLVGTFKENVSKAIKKATNANTPKKIVLPLASLGSIELLISKYLSILCSFISW